MLLYVTVIVNGHTGIRGRTGEDWHFFQAITQMTSSTDNIMLVGNDTWTAMKEMNTELHSVTLSVTPGNISVHR
ncbi:hypothetical protein N643_09080 [Salmonella bongori serovar 48:z41:-- str. RKS3044]|uniref:Uncharacterized protein n=1 Tax=Salmonella bongori serovar 44:r:- TaxID=1967585 RepID=A0A702FQG2_SALBN|nr:hypothetical protein N643_09080 [Salmonella bongori serovar 48:z41:-- str. RKS3044]HAC6696548.1 hypothetical protein [Salmonella bongori serovar 44:r:-]